MHQYGHYGAALLGYAPLGFVLALAGFDGLALAGAVGAAGLAMLPDVDQRIPFVEHRGPTHTIWFAAAVGIALGLLGVLLGAQRGILAALGAGALGLYLGTVTVCSHVAADALTPAGVAPFAPRRQDWYSYDVATASNPIANYALLGLGGVVCVLAIALGSQLSEVVG